ncbi:MAG: hypothetical protein SFY95_10960 [Planctomycetota bacterium]|nr:hypothetical protein [Planctomycetota bacterium]
MPVRRCVCFDVTFEALSQLDKLHGEGLAGLHCRTGCGGKCGLCIPYIQVMLRTGQTRMPIMWTRDFKALNIAPGAVGRIEDSLWEIAAITREPPPGMPDPPPHRELPQAQPMRSPSPDSDAREPEGAEKPQAPRADTVRHDGL